MAQRTWTKKRNNNKRIEKVHVSRLWQIFNWKHASTMIHFNSVSWITSDKCSQNLLTILPSVDILACLILDFCFIHSIYKIKGCDLWLSAFEPQNVHLYLAKPISSACSLKVLLDMLIPYFLIRPWQAPVTLHALESFPNFLGWECNCFFIFSSKCFDHL